MYIDRHVTYPLFLSDFNENRIFSTVFFEKHLNTKFHETPPVGAELLYADTRKSGRT